MHVLANPSACRDIDPVHWLFKLQTTFAVLLNLSVGLSVCRVVYSHVRCI